MSELKLKKREDLYITNDSEFFVAIGYQSGATHTFIFVGVRDKKTQKVQLLNAVGKYFDPTKESISCPRLKALFSAIPAKLREENFLFDDLSTSISYKAFQISENQYENYLQAIGHCTRSRYMGAYHIDTETPIRNGQSRYIYDEFQVTDTYEAPINQKIKKLSLNNNCRHSAIDLLHTTIDQNYQHRDIPSFFLFRLPLVTQIFQGQVIDRFFIFPPPPSPDDLTPKRYVVLAKLYRQLENISRSYLKNDNTVKKFNALKDLYQCLDTRQPIGLFRLFSIIEDWEATHHHLIDAKRGFSFFKHTATRNMVEEMKHLKPFSP